MSSSSCYAEHFRRVYVQPGLERSPHLRRALQALPGVPVEEVQQAGAIPPEHLNQHTLYVCRPRGRTVTRCPGSRGHLCCSYLTVDMYLGCPLGCSYCIMRGYLNFQPLTVYLDPEASIRRLAALAARSPGRPIRAGTGEVGDSLWLDPLFALAGELIRGLAPYPNLSLELKTKTHFVDHLLEVSPKGRAVIGFSLNPAPLAAAFEGAASSVEQRLEAARRAARAGYRLAFHFDPLILSPDWEAQYAAVVRSMEDLPPQRVAWISLGTVRYPRELRERLGSEELLLEEFVPCRDGKYRYLQPVRSRMYRALRELLRRRFPETPVYLCMESAAVWQNVFGSLPGGLPGVRELFPHRRRRVEHEQA